MKQSTVEITVGFFVLIGIMCIAYLTIQLGEMKWIGGEGYPIFARFTSVSGLNTGARVEIAGVKIGVVEDISLDKERKLALIKMKIQKDIKLSDDVIASVKTSGLIGDKFVMISPGGSDQILKSGDMITETESVVDIESLISKYVFGHI
ncbi:MAG: outer membrane lipid asymmetry maintenance protein MlaD [Desulfobacterales bacterium]|nr:outer membrane lipid asymmetry maintenance protein MlaD [Desulfobacterales bacterium]